MSEPGAPAEVSIVIAAHNAAEYLAEQLEALCEQSCMLEWEVVVVDNNSTDRTAAVAQSFRDRLNIKVVGATSGRGAGYARNVGVAATQGSLLIFIDADDVVSANWLSTLAAALEENRFVAGPAELDRLNEPWVADSRGRRFADEATSFLGIFPYAASCNLGVHREVFEEVGGFDESFIKGQDIELSLRIWQSGVELHFEPDAVVHYRLRVSLLEIFEQSRRYGAVQPVILERLRREGIHVPGRFDRAKVWGWLIVNVPLLRHRSGRARWLWTAGTQLGRLEGGLRIRRLYL